MDQRPDVLFVVLDSLRKDHVSTYGYHRKTTPNLDRFADGGTVFENAYVPAPWTLPSHCSMFTGLVPTEHGITNGFTDRDLTLPEDCRTVTERLDHQGYRTAGYSNNPWVGTLSGLDRGFDRFVEWDLEQTRGRPTRHRDRLYDRAHTLLGRVHKQPLVLLKRRFFTSNLVERARRWIDAESRPVFTFCNLMEAHSPYYPPRWAFRELGLSSPGPVAIRSLNTKLLASVMGKRTLSLEEQHRVYECLDASIRYQDRQFDRLLRAFEEANRLEDALVVVCADHGKTLGEFDRDGEIPHYLRNINVEVPLVVKWPGQTTATTVSTPVELAGLNEVLTNPITAGSPSDPAPLETVDGHALVEDSIPHTASESQAVDQWRALADEDTSYLRGPDDREYVLRGSGAEEKAMPLEEVDGRTLAGLRERLTDRVQRMDARTAKQRVDSGGVDGELESQLEDLGYLN